MTSAFSYIKQLEDLLVLAPKFAPQFVSELNSTLKTARGLFHEAFFIGSCQCYHETEQAGDVMALASGSVPNSLVDSVVAHLIGLVAKDGFHFSTGIISIPHLFNVLHDHGHADSALRIMTQTDYPSYGYTFSNSFDNATALHEIWNFAEADGGMNSFAHHMFGSVADYFFTRLLGFRLADTPSIVVPTMSGVYLQHASGCWRGDCVEWSVDDGGMMMLSLDLTRRTSVVFPDRKILVEPGRFDFKLPPMRSKEAPAGEHVNRFKVYARKHNL